MFPIRVQQCSPTLARRLGFDPFGEFDRLASTLFADEPRVAGVKVDLRETPDHYLIHADLPGFRKEDVSVTLNDNVLTLSASNTRCEKTENEKVHLNERCVCEVSRSFRLPNTVKSDKIEADLKDGVLTVRLAKIEEVKPRRIEVRGA